MDFIFDLCSNAMLSTSRKATGSAKIPLLLFFELQPHSTTKSGRKTLNTLSRKEDQDFSILTSSLRWSFAGLLEIDRMAITLILFSICVPMRCFELLEKPQGQLKSPCHFFSTFYIDLIDENFPKSTPKCYRPTGRTVTISRWEMYVLRDS